MSLHSTDGEFISLKVAQEATKRYRAQVDSTFKGQFFGKDQINQIFNENPDCLGVRIYNAIDGDGKRGFILVGAVANDGDLYEDLLLANGPTCPGCCAIGSPLNEI